MSEPSASPRRRERRPPRTTGPSLAPLPRLENPWPPLEVLASEQLERILLAAFRVLEEAGLEIKDRDGRWLALNPPPGSLVVNVGDMLQRLTNHVLVSTTHRVTNPAGDAAGRSRYSMPFFLHFAPEFLIRTLPNCVGPGRPDRHPEPITARAYLEQRLREIKLLG